MRTSTSALVTAILLGVSSVVLAAESTTTGTTISPSATTPAPNATTGATTSPSTTPGSGTSSPTMSEVQIKQKLEKDGYTNITGLKAANDGAWMGKAMRNGKEVTVDVDQQGMVTAK
jgi:hypothetical protein